MALHVLANKSTYRLAFNDVTQQLHQVKVDALGVVSTDYGVIVSQTAKGPYSHCFCRRSCGPGRMGLAARHSADGPAGWSNDASQSGSLAPATQRRQNCKVLA